MSSKVAPQATSSRRTMWPLSNAVAVLGEEEVRQLVRRGDARIGEPLLLVVLAEAGQRLAACSRGRAPARLRVGRPSTFEAVNSASRRLLVHHDREVLVAAARGAPSSSRDDGASDRARSGSGNREPRNVVVVAGAARRDPSSWNGSTMRLDRGVDQRRGWRPPLPAPAPRELTVISSGIVQRHGRRRRGDRARRPAARRAACRRAAAAGLVADGSASASRSASHGVRPRAAGARRRIDAGVDDAPVAGQLVRGHGVVRLEVAAGEVERDDRARSSTSTTRRARVAAERRAVVRDAPSTSLPKLLIVAPLAQLARAAGA